MMNSREIGEALGASHIIERPAGRQPSLDFLTLMKSLHSQLLPGQGRRPGRPTNPAWEFKRQVPFARETWSLLQRYADALSTPERRVSPAQLAASILEQVVVGTPQVRREGEAEPGPELPACPAEADDIMAAGHLVPGP